MKWHSPASIVTLQIFLVITPTIAQRLNLPEYVTIQSGQSKYPLNASESYDVGIDQMISIDWDENLLSRHVGISRGLISTSDPLSRRIQFLEDVAKLFYQAQELLVEVKAVASRLEASKISVSDSATQANLRNTMLLINSRYSQEARAGLRLVDTALKTMALPDDKALAIEFRAAIEMALLSVQTTPAKVTGEFLLVEIDKLNKDLTKKLEEGERIRVFMTASIHGEGTRRPLHLDNYDNMEAGWPDPYPRFQLALSERTTREFESAQKLGEMIKNTEQLVAEVKAAISAIREEVKALIQTLHVDVLASKMTQLVRSLRDRGDATLQPLIAKVNDLLGVLQILIHSGDIEMPENATSILRLVDEVTTHINGVLRSTRTLPTLLVALAGELETKLSALPGSIDSGTIQALRQAADDIQNRPEIHVVFKRIDEIQEILGLTNKVVEKGLTTSAIGRNVGPGKSLDTNLDLLTIGERHPGEIIIIEAIIVSNADPSQEEIIARTRQQFTLREFEFYIETRGSLLFVDPIDSIYDSQSFETVPAVSFVGHYGVQKSSFWNDVLNPGVGVTFVLMDFDDSHDFEFGISGSLTLFRDLLWTGYGRNIQAKTNYYYFGINPLALGDFLHGPGNSVP